MTDETTEDSALLFNLTSDSVENSDAATKKIKIKTRSSKKGTISFIKKSNVKKTSKSLNKLDATNGKNISKLLKKSDSTKFEKDSFSKPKSDKPFFSSLFTSNPLTTPLSIHQVKKGTSLSEPLFAKKSFADLDLHSHLVGCLKTRFDIGRLTHVQEKTIPVLLSGADALVKSCTGSGKTLAYAVPIVQKLQEISPHINRSDGVLALVIVPTRELALQCFETFSLLTKACTWVVPGYLIGGEKKKSEKARLRKGINILISTPGRLLDHLERTACLSLEKIKWLVIDEADRLLEEGFKFTASRIISHCASDRQSALLSATISKEVESLAGMCLTNPQHIDISTNRSESEDFHDLVLPSQLKQYVTVVPPKQRLVALSSFLVDKVIKGSFKCVIFFCSQKSVNFHYSLMADVLGKCLEEEGHKCKFFELYGSMKQEDRTEIFKQFRAVKEGVLFCTDVGARGLDVPHVDWIIQYSAPSSADIYVHRVGRTARIGKKGNALLFLLPTETKFSQFLAQNRINFEEVSSNQFLKSLLLLSRLHPSRKQATAEECASALQANYEKVVYEEKELHSKAKDAFASYVESYSSYPKNVRHALPFKSLHLGHTAKSFCLREAPTELGRTMCLMKRGPHMSYNTKKGSPSAQKLPVKRKASHLVSEYDSGLSSLNISKSGKKAKRRKTSKA